jgi:hypothetical protein
LHRHIMEGHPYAFQQVGQWWWLRQCVDVTLEWFNTIWTHIPTFFFNYMSELISQRAIHYSVLSGSLSPRHGAPSGCGWRNGLQLWSVAANTLNKKSRTADKGWSSSLLTNPHRKKLWRYEPLHNASDLDRFFGTIPATERGHEIWNMECNMKMDLQEVGRWRHGLDWAGSG